MPELPEVETICNGLRTGDTDQPSLIGKQISEVHVFWNRTIQAPTVDEFIRNIRGREILEITRRGKFIVLRLGRGFLIVHLRMSGDLFFREAREIAAKHDRVIFYFVNGGSLVFNDTRKFGRIWLVDEVNDVLGDLGLEPFDPEFNGIWII